MKTIAITALVLMSLVSRISVAQTDLRLPIDNTATISVDQQVRLQLDLPDDQDRATLSGAKISVVDRHGVARKFVADQQGFVTLDQMLSGPHAIVASIGTAYGSTVLLASDATESDESQVDRSHPVRVTLATVNADKLMPWMEQFASGFARKQPSQLGQVKPNLDTNPSRFNYRIKLNDGGVLEGQLISILEADVASQALRDTEVVLMQKGIAIGKTFADAAGKFQFKGVRPGVHGLVAAGPSGYATLAFETFDSSPSLGNAFDPSHRLVSAMDQQYASLLPVAMIPPAMIPGVIDPLATNNESGAGLFDGSVPTDQSRFVATGLENTGLSMGGGLSGNPISSGGGGGSVVSGGGGSGGGGFGLLSAAAAAGIAIPLAVNDDSDDAGPVASPSGL